MTSTQTLLRQPSESSFTAPSALRMDHLFDMTTDIGIWQHAKGSKPDRRHGYSIDDQARALEAQTRQLWQARQTDRVLKDDEVPRFSVKR